MKRSVFSRYSLILVLTALALAFAAIAPLPASAQQAVPVQPLAPPTSITSSDAASEGYILGAGDRVRIIVFGEPNLSGEFVVDSTGKVALPLVGEVNADGLPLRAFERAVVELLKVDYLKDPRVSVEVLNFRPFYILGEVNRPGTYPYTSGLTVRNAVVTAGGYTYRANKGKVKIQHQGADKEVSQKLTPGLTLQPGDTITILERWY